MAGGSFYAMLAISGFFTAIWMVGKISAMIGVSSIVLEVAIGLILGPQVGNLIPGELSECFALRTVNCDERKYQLKIANKGYKYCDLGAYLENGRYIPADAHWTTGFWGNVTDGLVIIPGKKGGTYCLDLNSQDCSRRLAESDAVFIPESEDDILGSEDDIVESVDYSLKALYGGSRRLADDKEGKVDHNWYSDCILSSCTLDVAMQCSEVPDIFTLVGHIGVAMMIFESGLHFDFEQAKTVGPWACAVAVLGTFLPLVTGAGMAVAFKFDLFPDGVAAGTALAPTSVGIALKLLHEAKALETFFGQAVMTAAFVDDVLSLILFSILFKLDNLTFMNFLPLILGIVFMFVAIIAAVKVWPPLIKFILERVPEKKPDAKVTTHDEVMWFLMFIVLVAYASITFECGTHLWGCFIAGMSFASTHHSHHVWVKQVKRMTCWFLRIFFACTLAWAIPVTKLFSWPALWRGTLMGLGPCIATKVLCGPFMGSARWVIGWAMVGRAEFAYFIAILAKSVEMMDEDLFAILVWALLYATIFAPLVFRYVLKKYMLSSINDPEEAESITRQISSMSVPSNTMFPDLEGERLEEEYRAIRQSYHSMEGQLTEKVDEIHRVSVQSDFLRQESSKTVEEKDKQIQQLKADLKNASLELKNAYQLLADHGIEIPSAGFKTEGNIVYL